MTLTERATDRSWKTLAPTFAVAFVQLVVTIVLYVLWGIDSIHVAGCTTCESSRTEVHRLIFLIPTAIAWIGTLLCIPVGYVLNRSPAWVPVGGIVIIIGAYVSSRIYGYQGM